MVGDRQTAFTFYVYTGQRSVNFQNHHISKQHKCRGIFLNGKEKNNCEPLRQQSFAETTAGFNCVSI